MNKPTSRLGRGLSSLIRPATTLVTTAGTPANRVQAPDPEHGAPPPMDANVAAGALPAGTAAGPVGSIVREIPIGAIQPNPNQPRALFDESALDELAASIKTSGVLQPILVRPMPSGQFQLVAGERRWRAARKAGLATIPAVVRRLNDSQAYELSLIENLQREDLTPLERAAAYQHYIEAFKTTADDLAARIGESRANISNYLRLLRLPDEIREAIRRGELGMGQARALAGIVDPQRLLAVARMATRRNLSVRQVEGLARQADPETAGSSSRPRASADDRQFEKTAGALSRSLGVHVRLRRGKKKNSGIILIQFGSLEEFDRITSRLNAGRRLEVE